jgi:hypothetical protein
MLDVAREADLYLSAIRGSLCDRRGHLSGVSRSRLLWRMQKLAWGGLAAPFSSVGLPLIGHQAAISSISVGSSSPPVRFTAIWCNVLVSGCDADHCRGNSTKPMLIKYLTAFLTTVSGNLVFRHRASKDPSWPLSLISTIAARTGNSVAVPAAKLVEVSIVQIAQAGRDARR